jgi:hypothetical protein
MGGYN